MNDFSGMLLQANLIGGKWSAADTGATIAVLNPATGAELGQVPNCGTAETNRAIAAATAAFADWSRSNLSFRVGLLHKLHEALMDHLDELEADVA